MAKSGYITIEQGAQNIANNTTPITVNGYVVTSGESYRGSHRTGTYSVYQGGKLIYSTSFTSGAAANSTTRLFSVTLTVSHNADGTSGTITASYNYDGGWATGSGSKALSTIPRQATITSAPNFNDEQNPSITYSNPAGNAATSVAACISLDSSKDDIKYRTISKTGTSYTFNLTDEERQILRNACLNYKSREVIFYVRTEIGNQTFYSTLRKTLTIVNAEPVLSASVEDVNSSTLSLTGNKNIFVKYKSNALFSMSASTFKGATIKSYKVVCGNKQSTLSAGTLYGVEDGKFVFEVTDSRGYVASVTLNKEFVDYVSPTCVFNPETPSADGEMKIHIDGKCFKGLFGRIENQVYVQYRYKSELDEQYSNWIELDDVSFDNGQYFANDVINNLDYTLQYTFQGRLLDSLMSAESAEYSIKVIPAFYWGKEKFFFNVPVNIMGFDQDYIVDQGTDGIWTYRKWASGISECWGTAYLENVDCGAKNYSGFYYSDTLVVNFPSGIFNGKPIVTTDKGPANYIAFTKEFGSTKDAANFLICGLQDATTSFEVHIQAKGRWK